MLCFIRDDQSSENHPLKKKLTVKTFLNNIKYLFDKNDCRGTLTGHKIDISPTLPRMKASQNISNSIDHIENRLGYFFKDRQLLTLAFIHRSYVNESPVPIQHNERLEFLGDSVLDLMISEYLYKALPNEPEGELSSLRAKLVEANSCISYIQKLDLGKYLVLGRGERMNDGRGRDTILSDLFEALLGAIFLDGGLSSAQKFFFDHFKTDIDATIEAPLKNPKALLQDLCQKKFQCTPTYRVLSETGPDHNKTFKIAVMVHDEEMGLGEGPSKKEAQQAAARSALSRLQQ